ncbi:MAG: transcription elongation factor GreA [Bacteroides sp.]|jgi:transcription elongation factor greA
MADYIYLTPEGLAKLENELTKLKSVERPAVIQAIAEARDKGDLSENAEYDAAKEAQVFLENQIAKLEQTLAKARVLDTSKLDLSKVQLHCKVKLMNHTMKKEMEFKLVSQSEADLREGKLAVETPIAKALLGHKVGETIEVQVPSGLQKIEILEIGL